eukprot:131159-Prorocentrum_lima.AAC.1
MTSSLVGSEMCIRDRALSVGNVGDNTVQRALMGDLGEPFAMWDSGVSVSYTHLTLPTICSV